jgi:chromate transporter
MVTPALVVLLPLRLLGPRAQHPRLGSAIRAASAASAGLMIAATMPLGRETLIDSFLVTTAITSFALLSFTRIDSLWIVVGSAIIGVLRIVISRS